MRWRLGTGCTRVLPLLLAVVLALAVLSACGSGGGTAANPLSVTVRAADSSSTSVSAGDLPSYTVAVVNHGAGSVEGVAVAVTLPAGFRYKATTATTGNGEARTQSDDAAVNSPNPSWGLWSLPSPSLNPDGSKSLGEVDITFTAIASGAPGAYDLSASALSNSSDNSVSSRALSITINPSPQMSMDISAAPEALHSGGSVTYNVTITNTGSGSAPGVTVLVVMPSSFSFVKTTSLEGNSARASGLGSNNPVVGGNLVDYGGFTVPASSSGGPGVLVITFTATVIQGAASGEFPTSGQLTDASGLIVTVPNTVPVEVVPSATPAPTATPTPL